MILRMRLEDEIGQRAFRSAYHKLGVNLLYSGSWMGGIIGNWLKPYGLTPQQYNVLRILRGCHPKPVSVAYVKARMLDKTSNVSRLVERLRTKHLVDRHECPSDRRSVDLSITDKGVDLLDDLDGSETNWLSALSTLDESDAARLNELLDRLRNSPED